MIDTQASSANNPWLKDNISTSSRGIQSLYVVNTGFYFPMGFSPVNPQSGQSGLPKVDSLDN